MVNMTFTLAIFIIAIYLRTEIQCLVATGPSNMAVIAGSTAILQCQITSSTMRWEFLKTDVNIPSDTNIFNGFSISGNRHEVDNHSAGVFNLRINNTQLSDAGVYICVEAQTQLEARAHLIVLESAPSCASNVQENLIEFQNISLACVLLYNGYWAPVMSWQRDGGAVITAGVVKNTVAYKSVTYSLTVAATRNLTGITYTCTTYFNEANRPMFNQTINIQPPAAYKYIWKSTTITVLYGPDQVRIIPFSTHFQPGDEITCSAEGHPRPTYQWRQLANNYSVLKVVVGPQITVGRSQLGSEVNTWQCVVMSDVGGRNKTAAANVTFSVLHDVRETTTDPAMIAVYVAGLATVVAVIQALVILIVVKYKRNHQANGGPDKKHDQTEVVHAVVNHEQVYDPEKLTPHQSVYVLEDKSSTGSSKQMECMQSSLKAGDGTIYAQLDLTKYRPTSIRKPTHKLVEESAYAEIDHTKSKIIVLN